MYSLSAHALTNKMCRRLNDAFKNNQTKGNDCGFIIKKDIVPADAEYQNLKENSILELIVCLLYFFILQPISYYL